MFVFISLCIFCLPNISRKVLEHFSQSSSHLILTRVFATFDCFHSSWCNLPCKFSIIDLDSGSIFSCKVQFLEKDGTCIFGAWFCIFHQVTCAGEVEKVEKAEKVIFCIWGGIRLIWKGIIKILWNCQMLCLYRILSIKIEL